MSHEIIPPELAIRSMRDSGYQDAAHAVAELIDNSIQAGLDIKGRTNVELICLDKVEIVRERRRTHIDRIAVYDDAEGMDGDVLRMALQFGNGTRLAKDKQTGMGKYGMGLPNASISQCRRVDVWSWQDGQTLHTYIDIDEIGNGRMREVPQPKPKQLPKVWRELIDSPVLEHGTLVVWSKIDRARWSTSTAFLRNSEFLLGRMYRRFIAEKQVRIRTAAFEDSGVYEAKVDVDVRPNDPIYLMAGTCSPSPYDKKPAFELVEEYPFEFTLGDEKHSVRLRLSVCSQAARDAGGTSPIGIHANRNQGVSLLRAGREISLSRAFDIAYDPRERWWGCEVGFDPGLDEIFGVTNNKQAALAFKALDLDGDAKAENRTPEKFLEELRETGDHRWVMYRLSNEISKKLNTLRNQIKRMREKTKPDSGSLVPGSKEDIATRATKKRKERDGAVGESDKDEDKPEEDRRKELADTFRGLGETEEVAKREAKIITEGKRKFAFEKAELPGSPIFDVKSKAGVIIVVLNVKHPAYDELFGALEGADDQPEEPALRSLWLLLASWARLEDESTADRRRQMEDTRQDWGRIARGFLEEIED